MGSLRSRDAVYTREGGEKLAIKAMSDGLRSPKANGRKTLLVRIPPSTGTAPTSPERE